MGASPSILHVLSAIVARELIRPTTYLVAALIGAIIQVGSRPALSAEVQEYRSWSTSRPSLNTLQRSRPS